MAAIANQIETALKPGIDDLQVWPKLVYNPTPPVVDVYPASDNFQEGAGMGAGNNAFRFTVRARVATPEIDGAQDLLLSMMDPEATATSVTLAIEADRTLGGGVGEATVVEGPTGYGIFPEPGAEGAFYLGCLWTVQVYP